MNKDFPLFTVCCYSPENDRLIFITTHAPGFDRDLILQMAWDKMRYLYKDLADEDQLFEHQQAMTFLFIMSGPLPPIDWSIQRSD